MRRARVFIHDTEAGALLEEGGQYVFTYRESYQGPPLSLTMPVHIKEYRFSQFPPFFDGLLPEGIMLDALLRQNKIDRKDYFGQLLAVGRDLVGAVTIEEIG
jgi:serine/threonine-protein kinase HipA